MFRLLEVSFKGLDLWGCYLSFLAVTEATPRCFWLTREGNVGWHVSGDAHHCLMHAPWVVDPIIEGHPTAYLKNTWQSEQHACFQFTHCSWYNWHLAVLVNKSLHPRFPLPCGQNSIGVKVIFSHIQPYHLEPKVVRRKMAQVQASPFIDLPYVLCFQNCLTRY